MASRDLPETLRAAPRDPAWTMPASVVLKAGPLARALVREHCRGAKRHVEWARFDEESAADADGDEAADLLVHARANWFVAAEHLLRALLVAALLCPAVASAQSDETLLLRSCISERSFRTDVDDCLIVAEVVRERMAREGGSFASNIRALAPRLHGHPCRASRAWLCDLDVDCHRPRGLTATWETPRGDEPSRREACEETVPEVRAILAGSLVSTCVERPRHWGSRSDVARRLLAGLRWVDAVCPGLVLLNRAGFLYRRIEE